MFKSYNEAQNRFYKGLKGTKSPIITIEFFGYRSLQQSFEMIQKNWTDKVDYEKVTRENGENILIVDASLKIIFASDKISEMNGYYNSEIIGKSPKMFQGKDTDRTVTARISAAISERKPFKEILLNYKKDGSVYYCNIEAYPKFDENGNLLNYIAFERAA